MKHRRPSEASATLAVLGTALALGSGCAGRDLGKAGGETGASGAAPGREKAVNAKVTVVDRPQLTAPGARAGDGNDFYVGNREPLLPSPLMKLPIGAVRPAGWLRKLLELQADGFIGRLSEISRFLKKDGNAWLSPEGEGHSPWEELPYWLKGFGDTGYVLGDERIVKEARIWIEAALGSRREDGYFGPRANLKRSGGKIDFWPNMVMLFALQSYHEYSGDERVLDLMTAYFRWQATVPDEDFLVPYWQQQRGADNLFSVHWLYNRTGERWLLDLATKVHRNTAKWTDDVVNWHNVNMSQAFGGPATYYVQSKDPRHLEAAERNYRKIRDSYGQVPGGMFGGDENCRPGYTGPRQAVETCGMVEMMLSCEDLVRITGDVSWADRCEDVAVNSLPAATMPDMKALRYLTAPNMVLSDRKNKSPGLQNRGPMLHMNPHRHRCCQHNMGHGWPYYAESLWAATPGNGLAAVLYAASEVTAKVGDGTEVTIAEKTRYPFDERIELAVSSPEPVRFPLYLRVPGWSGDPEVSLNGRALAVDARPESYIAIEREWADGDALRLTLPMRVNLRVWERNRGSVSVDRGPLTYSLKIGERYVREGGTDEWPAWEIHPTTPWNYGLVLDAKDPASSFGLVRKDWPATDRPFEAEAAPVTLTAKVKRISGWRLDALGLVGKLRQSPVRSDEPVEEVALVPMGAARLRIASFPVIGEGPDANEWGVEPVVTASHCWGGDTVGAAVDGVLPKSSDDHGLPRFTWWDHRGTTEWIELDFPKPREVSSSEVYWFDDTGRGQCRVPESWRLLYRDGDEWKPVEGAAGYGVERDRFSAVTFRAVTTDAVRIEAKLRDGFSGGILEWRVK